VLLTGIGGRRGTDGDRAERLARRRRRLALGQYRAHAARTTAVLQMLQGMYGHRRRRRRREAAVHAWDQRAALVSGRHDRPRVDATTGRPVLMVALHRQPVLGQELVQVAILKTEKHVPSTGVSPVGGLSLRPAGREGVSFLVLGFRVPVQDPSIFSRLRCS